MRLISLLLTLALVALGSAYWYTRIDATCRIPVHYKIGAIDARFGTTPEAVQKLAAKAEALWEAPLGKELFVYDANATFAINFVYDERQENADTEAELRQDLEAKQGMSDTVKAQYEKLIASYRSLKKEYESKVVAYERELKAYNTEVASWNTKGGAPPSVIDTLTDREQELKREREAINALAAKLNTATDELNKIGAKGNELVTDYNAIVSEYNKKFSEPREFAQGDYTGDAINIYEFNSDEELVVVLAHELGHALSLKHVENPESIMFYLMEEQTSEAGVSNEDLAEFTAVCETKEKIARIFAPVLGMPQ